MGLFGEADADPILGATALASAGIEVDPLNQRLERRAAVRLKTNESEYMLPLQEDRIWP